MRRHLQAAVAATSLIGSMFTIPAKADDTADVRSTISGQLDAFRTNNGQAAYSFAAPNIRQIFPNAEIFMTMVERGYPAVYHSSNATFGPMRAENGGFRQEVFLSDSDGQSWIASYTLQRLPDGSIKISGCQIRKGDDIGA